MPWWFHVVERRHDFQNPTSREKISVLGQQLGLGPQSSVLDVASGRGGPALVLAEEFGCRITCVERSEEFLSAAEQRLKDAGLASLVELVHSDARLFTLERERYDAVICLGASFIWDGLSGTVAALRPAARPGGFVAVGEPYWRTWPLPDGFEPDGDEFATLAQTVQRLESAGLNVVSLIASSTDDWDAYESLHWLALEEWLHEHPHDPDAEEFRKLGSRYRERYLRWERDLLGWAIIAGRKR